MYYNTIVLSGGSIKILSTLGALQYCYDQQLLTHEIETYIGTSAGAIICYLLVIGYTPIEILCYYVSHNLFKNKNYLDVASMFNGEGAISFSDIHEHLEKLTIDKIGKLLTFKDIKSMFGKDLIMTTYNYTKRQVEYLSAETTPDIPCLSGVRMSSSLPFIFNMYKYEDSYYIDGGLADNFPVEYIRERQADDKHALGFHIDIFKDIDGQPPQGPMAVIQLMYTLLSIPLRELERHKMTETGHVEVINIHNDTNVLNFNMTSKEKLDLFSEGYQIAQNHFNS